MYGPGQPPDRVSVINGELQAGGNGTFVYVSLEYSEDRPEGHSGQLAYTFLIHIQSTSLT